LSDSVEAQPRAPFQQTSLLKYTRMAAFFLPGAGTGVLVMGLLRNALG
jgi:hypothetical protein